MPYSAVGTIRGFLKPLTEEESANNSIQFGQGYSFYVKLGADLQTEDRLIIKNTEYTVRGATEFPTSAGYLKAILEKPQNE